MAITLLGADGLNDLMDTDVRISVANRTRAAVPVTIVAALVVLHDEDGTRQIRNGNWLDIEPGTSRIIATFPPTDKQQVAAEILLRLHDGLGAGIVQTYAKVEAQPADELRDVLFGVTNADDSDEPSATPIVEAPEFACFAGAS